MNYAAQPVSANETRLAKLVVLRSRERVLADAAAGRSPETQAVTTGSSTCRPPQEARRPGLEAISLDVLAAHWLAALDVAADALVVANGCRKSLGFADHELDERRGRLARERDATTRLLALVAHEEHVQLHGLSAPRANASKASTPSLPGVASGSLKGRIEDLSGVETVDGLAGRKNEALMRRLDREGVTA